MGEASSEASPTAALPFEQSRLASAPDLPSAVYDPAAQAPIRRQPVGLRIDELRVEGAPVVAVGVLDDGEMEVPSASEVGWYRFGSSPGESGTAVLAAHIAYNGRDGVFRRLSSLNVGAKVVVKMEDGVEIAYRVTAVEQHRKESLPAGVFAKDGESRLALISCGGSFNPSLRRYDSNVIAYAVPVS